MTTGNLPASDLEFGKPGELGLVIRLNPKTGERSFDQLIWGLLPHDTQDHAVSFRPIWARPLTEYGDFLPHLICQWYQPVTFTAQPLSNQ
jgi:hypothetical protein